MTEIKKIETSKMFSKLNINSSNIESINNSLQINKIQSVEEKNIDKIKKENPIELYDVQVDEIEIVDPKVIVDKASDDIAYMQDKKHEYTYLGLKDKRAKYTISLFNKNNKNPNNKASCATFVNQVLYDSGLCEEGPRWYTANYKVAKQKLKDRNYNFELPDKPKPGDIFRDKYRHHCGIVAAVYGNKIETYEVVNNGKKCCAVHKTVDMDSKVYIRITGRKDVNDGNFEPREIPFEDYESEELEEG